MAVRFRRRFSLRLVFDDAMRRDWGRRATRRPALDKSSRVGRVLHAARGYGRVDLKMTWHATSDFCHTEDEYVF